MPVILRTIGLTKKYGEFFALKDVSLTLAQGDVYGLVGRNGAGKTTLFKCLMGLSKPSSGKIEIGAENRGLGAARKKMGFIISPSFFPYLNPRESLEYLRVVRGIKTPGETGRLLSLVGLDGVKKPFRSLSLGMKQRLGIAGALLGAPEIVVLDEPINGLDPQGIIDMRAVIRNVHAETGATFIISSHILSELDLVATRFGFIEQGSLIAEITREKLREQTKKTLAIETGDASIALEHLRSMGIEGNIDGGGTLVLDSGLERPNEIARALINGGFELYEMRRRETTLEEYFIKLTSGSGGGRDA